jgi:hypothetical protein
MGIHSMIGPFAKIVVTFAETIALSNFWMVVRRLRNTSSIGSMMIMCEFLILSPQLCTDEETDDLLRRTSVLSSNASETRRNRLLPFFSPFVHLFHLYWY